jgi:hypothetical protein
MKLREKFEDVQPLSAYYWPANVPPYGDVPPVQLLELTKNHWLDGCRIHVQYLNNDFFTFYPLYDYEQHYDRFIRTLKEIYGIDNVLKYFIERFHIENVDLKELIPMCFSGLFSVKKHVILDKCVEYYSNLMSFLIYDQRINNLDYGLLFEKAWLIIFNYKKYNKNYISLKAKDFVLKNYHLIVKNNSSKFKISTQFCRLNFDIYFDNKNLSSLYKFFISERECYIRNKSRKKFYSNELKKNNAKKIFHKKELEIEIKLVDSTIFFYVNGHLVIDYKIEKKNIVSILLYDISKENKLKI